MEHHTERLHGARRIGDPARRGRGGDESEGRRLGQRRRGRWGAEAGHGTRRVIEVCVQPQVAREVQICEGAVKTRVDARVLRHGGQVPISPRQERVGAWGRDQDADHVGHRVGVRPGIEQPRGDGRACGGRGGVRASYGAVQVALPGGRGGGRQGQDSRLRRSRRRRLFRAPPLHRHEGGGALPDVPGLRAPRPRGVPRHSHAGSGLGRVRGCGK
mmetsp:Transcript_7834/g.23068  ORF Transcript_7834/g.23068 Transcript_7834/m.23068 type:complete len:215 (+) Transcript_7834:435-1079(+)